MTDIQLSEAACDGIKVRFFNSHKKCFAFWASGLKKWTTWDFMDRIEESETCDYTPEDIGIETFSTDTLERYPAI